jgi:hypothetical protein
MKVKQTDSMDTITATVILLAAVLGVLWATRSNAVSEPALSRPPESTAELVSTQDGDIPPATIMN